MRKNLIKLLSGVLFRAAITTSPALAAENASNTIDELNSLIDVLKSDNILDNTETIANTDSNAVVDVDSEEEVEEEESTQLYAGANSSIPLTNFVFGFYHDQDSEWYTEPGKELSRSSAPFRFVAVQYGNGNISDVSIDGKSLSSRQYSDSKRPYKTNVYNVVVSWVDYIFINDSALTNLSNGTHTLRVVCSPSSRFDTNSKQQIKTIKFNLVD